MYKQNQTTFTIIWEMSIHIFSLAFWDILPLDIILHNSYRTDVASVWNWPCHDFILSSGDTSFIFPEVKDCCLPDFI